MKELKLSLVSFEQAKKLKELGFPQLDRCPQYKNNGILENGYTDLGEGCIFAPPLELVAKWFRDEKNIFINLLKVSRESKTSCNVIHHEMNDNAYSEYEMFEEWEDALNWGINKAIEKILQDK